MTTVFDVADYFLAAQDPEAGDLISNLKLQKLVYYAQGFSLAILGEPIFAEEIQAWPHGPVCPILYERFKGYGSGPIPMPERSFDEILGQFTADQQQMLGEVQYEYGQYSAWRLRRFTHEEAPWLNHRPGSGASSVIPVEELKSFFATLVHDVN